MEISKLPENMQQYLSEAKEVLTEKEYQEILADMQKVMSEFPEHMLKSLHFLSPKEMRQDNSKKGIAETSRYQNIYEAIGAPDLEEDALWFELSELVNKKEELTGYGSLNSDEKMIFLVDGFEREINNGGFLQFFSNSIGVYSHELLEVLKKIKAGESYSLVRDAIGVFNPQEEHHQNIDIESSLTGKSRDALGVLENKYHDNYQNLSNLLINYIRRES